MKNVMLDLETMGKGPRAAIVTIGAVFFDPMTGELGAEFEAHIHLSDSARFGEIDPDTVLWWLGQSDEARAAIAYDVDGEKRMALLQALQKFQEWLMANGQEGKRPYVWGNGAGFDCTIMANAYEAVRKVRFIGYWNGFQDRDVRTVVDMGRDLLGFDQKKDMPFEGVAHRALDDAKHQARYVSAIYQRMQAAINGCGMVGGAA
ncbi:3'-5' exonuclease [Aeromonas caviae]|uniref:3'-5' exonuclease n=1 Tax=Aeromonas caviae TaxID=648 RepID=UPI000FEB7479|nr:3'-5' exonuclease [Aeromonas caviae]RWT41915.1 3'-5' exoribonuclease [Aeromonas caviae]